MPNASEAAAPPDGVVSPAASRFVLAFAALALVLLGVTWVIGQDLLNIVQGDFYNLRAFQHLFARYDMTGALWATGVLVGAALVERVLPESVVDRFVGWISDHLALVAAFVATILIALAPIVYQNYPLAIDEFAPYLQAQVFAAGKLYAVLPTDLIRRLLPVPDQFFHYSTTTGQVIEGNYPSWAAILTPFMLVGAPWVANALAGAGVVFLAGWIAGQLFPERKEAAGWAVLLTVASPVVLANALSYYTMNLHLLVALAYTALLLTPTPARLVGAGLVGSVGLTLNNPLPHVAFAAPWIIWLAWRPDRIRNLLFLGLGYLPTLAIVPLWLSAQSQTHAAAPAPAVVAPVADQSFMEVVRGQLSNGALGFPTKRGDIKPFLAVRAIWLSKLYFWSVPGLACLAIFGARQRRTDARLRVLGWSFLTIAAAYLFVKVDQGHGWGARYFHPAWGVLPLLGVAWLVRDPAGQLWRRYVLALSVGSLVVLTPLRFLQMHQFIAEARSQVPEHDPTRPQVVFVTMSAGEGRYYPWDAVRNDPFLRTNTTVIASGGDERDEALIQQLFPGATLASKGIHGTVWNLP